MREIILGLYAGKKNSEVVYLDKGENVFMMQPFNSGIARLQLVFQYADGRKKMIPIHETGIARTIENIGLFACFWFECETLEQNYFVQVVIN